MRAEDNLIRYFERENHTWLDAEIQVKKEDIKRMEFRNIKSENIIISDFILLL